MLRVNEKRPPATQLLLNRIGNNMNNIRKQFKNGDKSRRRALKKKKMINAMREKSKRRRPTKFLLNKISRNMNTITNQLKNGDKSRQRALAKKK